MKTLLNWRHCILFATFAIGILAFLVIFGEDNLPLGQWLAWRVIFAMVAAASFYIHRRLTFHWARRGKITQFVNPHT